MLRRIFVLSLLFTFLSGFLSAQNRMTTEEYIDTYKDVAIKKMKEFHIPASITLAQGILESGSGNSRLARKANNHFGIKCHKDWNGKKFYMNDDEKHECFRKYKNPEESFRDHSRFLTQRGRYSFLFDYDITDYKSWAYGLKKAGYATNPKYPKLLIGIIERYHLDQYDKGGRKGKRKKQIAGEPEPVMAGAFPDLSHLKPVSVSGTGRDIFENNGVTFVIAKAGDTYSSLAKEFDIYSWQLYKYNETPKSHKVLAGEPVYLEKKKKKAEKKYKTHVVLQGESLWYISQLYGIRMKHLKKINGLVTDHNVPVGTRLKVR